MIAWPRQRLVLNDTAESHPVPSSAIASSLSVCADRPTNVRVCVRAYGLPEALRPGGGLVAAVAHWNYSLALLILWHTSHDAPGGSRLYQALRPCVDLSALWAPRRVSGDRTHPGDPRQNDSKINGLTPLMPHAKPGKLCPHFAHWLQRLAYYTITDHIG